MPRSCIRLGRGCSDNGIALPGTSRCRAHTRSNWGRTPSRFGSVYKASEWQSIRKRVLREEPVCAIVGCEERASEVDHVVPLSAGGDAFARDNLRALCREHHQKRSSQQGGEAAKRKRRSS